jgi:predicted amino acid dehydrogenase
MKEIIAISMGPASENYDKTISMLGEDFRVKRLGVDFNFKLALELVKKYRNECDIFAFGGFPTDIKVNGKVHAHHQVLELRRAAGDTPIADGSKIKLTAIPFFLKNLSQKEPYLFKGKSISFFSGITQWDYLPAYQEINPNMVFADPYMGFGAPKVIRGMEDLKSFLLSAIPIMKRLNLEKLKEKNFRARITQLPTMNAFFDSEIFVVNETQLDFIELHDLSGKIVIIDQLSKHTRKKLLEAKVEKVYSCFPGFIGMPHLGFNGLEAILMSHLGKNSVEQEDILDVMKNLKLGPEIYHPTPQENKPVERFSFVIHPLAASQFFLSPTWKPLANTPIAPHVEKIAANIPGYHYGKITGIRSAANGKLVEGDLFVIAMTPKMMLKQSPEKMYKALNRLCDMALKRGSKIIGLGAYTKIVGDAGVTVNSRSPIPVTTGNSLSSASTLWAAGLAIEKMKLVVKEGEIYQGTAMVVGATGSIGKVCAKILTNSWKRIIIAAPRPYKILELVRELQEQNPNAEIIGTSSPDRYSAECDLIITSTSAQGESVMDIEKVKPGCVICDVSRPFDISLEEAAKRPDVLVIASGEVELPGDIHMTHTLGLPGTSVYACLAETALLALEGRFEPFSISRDLQYDKVCEIDRIARKHGVKLSAIMGHAGEITETEIELCRQHAMSKLKKEVKEEDASLEEISP